MKIKTNILKFILLLVILMIEAHSSIISKKNINKDNNILKNSVLFKNWNKEKAKKIIIHLMTTENNDKIDNNLTHKIVGFYKPHDKKNFINKKIAIVETSDNKYCHVCGVNLSLFEFSKVSSGWILSKVGINIAKAGSWGYNDDVNIVVIGKDKYGLIIKGGYGNQGYIDEYFRIYTLVSGKYKEVLYLVKSSNNAGAVEEYDKSYYAWDSNITFKRDKKSKYYDLIVVKNGINLKKKVNKRCIYRFNGIKYEKIDK